MAAGLGAGSGAVFALVARLVPAERVGSVTGVVGAAGGLGGFFPPLVMGAVDSVAHDYTWGFVLLAVTATGAGTLAATAVRRRARAATDV
jgi:NNP family nitrate/nitrite transporter-like MFS transporter